MMDIYIANLRDDVTKDALSSSFVDLGVVEGVRIEHAQTEAGLQTYAVVSLLPEETASSKAYSKQSVVTASVTK